MGDHVDTIVTPEVRRPPWAAPGLLRTTWLFVRRKPLGAVGGVIVLGLLVISALSFLGYGVPPPFPSWGAMLSGSGRSYMYQAPWMAFWPGVAISLAVFGFNMLGDALRDVLDPRLRGSTGGPLR
ncbi:MAG: hypothetical protein HY726_17110 [Candidatus Rokubacteria bacterium]|nr:hypothetical protein [Candidatus Rokubacteria bacterium]